MLNQAELEFFKESNPNHRVLVFRIPKLQQEFVFRTLAINEYEAIRSIAADLDEVDELTCKVCCVHPKDYDFTHEGLAGIPKTFGSDILEASGFKDPSVITESYVAYSNLMETTRYSFMALIKAGMDDITWSEMEDWDWDKLVRYAAAARKVLEFRSITYGDLENIEMSIKDPASESDKLTNALMNGVDPMVEFAGEIEFKTDFVDYPLITGGHWRNGDVIDETRNQIYKRFRTDSSFL